MKKLLFLILLLGQLVAYSQPRSRSSLVAQANVIKNEVNAKVNTSLRIGQMFVDMINNMPTTIYGYTATGSGTYAVIVSPAVTSYVDGQFFLVKFTNTNGAAPTISVNGMAALNLVKPNGTSLTSGDIPTGSYQWIGYDGVDSNFKIIGSFSSTGTGDSPSASDTVSGIMKLYGTTGANTDGTITQAYITALLAGKQPLDGDLTAIGSISPSNDDIIQRKAGAWTNRTVAQFLSDLGLGTLATQNGTSPTGTIVGTTDTQTLTNKTLTSPIINFGSDANGDILIRSSGAYTRLPVGSNTQVLTINSGLPSWQNASAGSATFTGLTDGPGAYTGKSLNFVRVNVGETALEYQTPSQVKTAVGLSDLDNTSDASKPVSTAQAAADATVLSTSEGYTDAAIAQEVTDRDAAIGSALSGLSWKNVRVATTIAGVLSTSFENGDVIDGVTLITGNRILIKNQVTSSENGIRVVAISGTPARATDSDTNAELQNAGVLVAEGTSGTGTAWVQTQSAINIGSTDIAFQQLGSSTPNADASTRGIAKLYTSTGINTDGAMDQNSTTTALATKVTSVTITQPAAGITVTNSGVAQTPTPSSTIALANDLAGLEGLSSTGIPVRTATDTWAQRTITGTSNQITVTNGDGVSGNPILSLPGTLVLPNGTTATTQSANDNSTKVATTAYADAKVADAINDATTAIAPSQNAVFDALALKTSLAVSHYKANHRFTLNTQTASYVAVAADSAKLVRMNVASSNTFTVPLNATVAYPIGTVLQVEQVGAGPTTVVFTGGSTGNLSNNTNSIIPGRYNPVMIIKVGTDEWDYWGGPLITTLASGTYTPTLTNTTNVAASTAYVTGYTQVGINVTVFGKVDIDATTAANTATVLGFSLPIASNIAAEQDLGGTATSDSVASNVARIMGDATNDRASIVFKCISASNDSFNFQFTYQIK